MVNESTCVILLANQTHPLKKAVIELLSLQKTLHAFGIPLTYLHLNFTLKTSPNQPTADGQSEIGPFW